MKKLTLFVYPFICLYIIFNLLVLDDFLIFIDPVSLISVLLPTIAALFMHKNIAANQTLAVSLKVCWFSGGLTFLYGIILTFSYVGNDLQIILPGIAVSLLPLFYCFIISLLYAPYLYLANQETSQ